MTIRLLSAFTFLVLSASSLKAQMPVGYLSNTDSLKGFDEKKFIQHATLNGSSAESLKHQLTIAKKEFIHEKYYHKHDHEPVFKTSATTVIQPACTNMGFEDPVAFSGWATSSGIITDCVTLAGCCPNSGAAASAVIASGPGLFDPIVPSLPILSPFPGNKVARVNNSATGAVVNRIEQSFMVNSGNAIFQIASASVLNSDASANHCCEDQPGLVINLKDSAGNTLTCPYLAFNAPSQCCPIDPSDTTWHPYTAGFNQGYYRGWKTQTIDLSPYIGSFITVQITVMDCALTGHYGYSYIDCQCNPLEIDLNGTIFDATPQTPIDVSTCGSVTAAINAPNGLGPYLWEGPPGSGVSGVTTQSLSTTTPGTYTLTMAPVGSCFGPTIKYMILHVTPNPTVTNVTAQATCTNATGSGTINVASGTPSFTYSWSPPAASSYTANGLSPGTDYTVTVVDTFGCRGTTILSIASFTDGPTYTISPVSDNLTCLSPSLTVTAQTGTNTTAVWTHTPTANFDVTAPGSYSCVVTNTLTSCTATVPVTITSTTVAPVASYSLLCNATTATLSAQSSPGIALGWLAPTTPPSPISNPGISSASGIFTLTATNLTTGCKQTYTVESVVPTISVTTNPNITNLTCVTSSIQATTSSSTPSTSISWISSAGTFTTDAFIFTTAGTYTTVVALPGACSTQSVFTISTNTAVGANIASTSTVIPCSTDSLALNVSGSGGGPYTYTWTSVPTSTNSIYYVSTAGTYSVVVQNAANGCTTTATYTVSHETVDASFTADPTSGLMPLPVSFTNTSTNATDYTWNYSNGMPIDSTLDASTTFNWQGDYPVILTAIKGYCRDTAVRIIHVELVSFLTIPNVFTPNGDKANDEFILKAVNLGEISMTIFDRWGKKIYESTANGMIKWDGKTKSGADVDDGTYFYIIKAAGLDDKTYDYQGTVNIFR
jgi:gliding motility-associated-like protein